MQRIGKYLFNKIYGNSVRTLRGHGTGARDYIHPPTALPLRITASGAWQPVATPISSVPGVEELLWAVW